MYTSILDMILVMYYTYNAKMKTYQVQIINKVRLRKPIITSNGFLQHVIIKKTLHKKLK